MSNAFEERRIDASEFRRVLGHHPTGVAIVTALGAAGLPVGMTVGSFTSVSLDPPLVSFSPAMRSSSFTKLREASGFCVNVLGADQQELCRTFASPVEDKFRKVDWAPGLNGAPMIAGAVAWIHCEFESILAVGDHYVVIGRVTGLAAGPPSLPMIFFQGGYGRFSPISLSAPSKPDLVTLLRLADQIRPLMERCARELDVECQISAAVEDELVIVSSAARPRHALARPVGRRTPFVPPLGLAFVAWSSQATAEWLARGGVTDPRLVERLQDMAVRVRQRGWSIALTSAAQAELEEAIGELTVAVGAKSPEAKLHAAVEAVIASGSYEPENAMSLPSLDVRYLSAPIFDDVGHPSLAYYLFELPIGIGPTALSTYGEALRANANEASIAIGGTGAPL